MMNERARQGAKLTAALLATLIAALLLTYGVMRVQASVGGRVGFSGNPATNGGQTCTACHALGAATPVVSISGPTAVNAGQTYNYTVTINGGPAQTAGFNASVGNQIGVFAPTGGDAQVINGEITHTTPKAFGGGQAQFSFTWTAPNYPGVFTMYAAGNSSNGQFDLIGDGIGATSLGITVSGGGPTPTPTPTPTGPTLGFTAIASVSSPVDITHAGDARLFIVEQAGRIRIMDDNDQLLATPFLDISARVDDSNNEMGLLGLAFHPNYASNGYFYVNYTYDPPGTNLDRTRVSRFSVTAAPNVADPNSELVLLEFEQPYSNHNGGALHFGPDGYLYIASGDGGSGGDPDDNGQDNSVLLGKILRIDVNGSGAEKTCNRISATTAPYAIPPGNPFADGGGGNCDEIWATGLRNPWRFSFDRATGDLWIGDVGQGAREEVDAVAASAGGGQNFGWRCYEGNQPYNTTGCAPAQNYDFPVFDYPHTNGNCSITGGYVYRGQNYSGLSGHYLFSDYCTGKLWTLSGSIAAPGPTTWSEAAGSSYDTPTSFGEDLAGELYATSRNGNVYRITDPSAAPQTPQTEIAINDPTDVDLHWATAAANCSYEIHQSPAPYFAPDYTTRETTLGAGYDSYIASDVLGDGGSDFFVVRSLNCSAMRAADSNRVGGFDYALTAGGA